jgi:glycosyltransferase involved in cell wall biosynthesis
MACLLKAPGNNTKGIFTITTQERDKLVFLFPDIHKQILELKKDYFIGLHHNWHDRALKYNPIFDFHLAGADDLREVSGAHIPLLPMDACNFSPECFYPSPTNKFWDILFVARAVAFKGIPEFFLAIRSLYDLGKYARVLFICPLPPPGDGVVKNIRSLFESMFSKKEQDFFTLLTVDFRYPFPFDLPTLAHFYRSSRIFVHSAPDERRCRVAAYAWACGLPVVGMEAVGSVLSPAVRRPPYFYEADSYNEFPEKIALALEAASIQLDFSLVEKEISSEKSVFLFDAHLARLFSERGLRPPDEGGWFSNLDIRLGWHHGLSSGVNAVNQDFGTFLQFLKDHKSTLAEQLKDEKVPEEAIAKLMPRSPRALPREKSPVLPPAIRRMAGRFLRSIGLIGRN